jgi:hypothetical protein
VGTSGSIREPLVGERDQHAQVAGLDLRQDLGDVAREDVGAPGHDLDDRGAAGLEGGVADGLDGDAGGVGEQQHLQVVPAADGAAADDRDAARIGPPGVDDVLDRLYSLSGATANTP